MTVKLGTFEFDSGLGRIVTALDKGRQPRIAVLEAPGRDVSIKQYFGRGDRTVRIEGVLTGSNAQADRETLQSMADGAVYTFDDGAECFNVAVESVSFSEEAGRPEYVRFTITMRESE